MVMRLKAAPILAIILILTGCSSPENRNFENEIQAAYDKGFAAGHSQILLQNLEKLRAEMLACEAYQFAPNAIQRIAGLDCQRDLSKVTGINGVSASFLVMPWLVASSFLGLFFVGIWLLIPPIGRVSGQWRAALIERFEALRTQQMQAIQEEAESIRIKQIEPLEAKSLRLQTEISKAEKAAYQAKIVANRLAEEVNNLQIQSDQLRERLEISLAHAEEADDTAKIAAALASMGKKRT
jgi:hypothetical protein